MCLKIQIELMNISNIDEFEYNICYIQKTHAIISSKCTANDRCFACTRRHMS
jgi:hypothetical protein